MSGERAVGENVDALRAAVRRLVDEREIVALTIRYCTAIDGRAFDDLRDVMAPDVEADLGGPLRGVDAVIDRCRAVLEPLDASQHLVANHDVRVDGDRATCRASFHAQHVRRAAAGGGDGATFVVAGAYHDELRRTPGGWRITHRRLVPAWTSGNPAVLAHAR